MLLRCKNASVIHKHLHLFQCIALSAFSCASKPVPLTQNTDNKFNMRSWWVTSKYHNSRRAIGSKKGAFLDYYVPESTRKCKLGKIANSSGMDN